MSEILNEVLKHLTQIIALSLGGAITFAVKYALDLLIAQKEATIKKMGVEQYNFMHNVAEYAFYAIEQQYKGCPAEEKRNQFDKMLVKKFPFLKEEEVEHFRESVVGKVNVMIKDSGILNKAFEN